MKIVGFGACMIAGTPYQKSEGFLMRSCQMLKAQISEICKSRYETKQESVQRSVEVEIVSLPSFSIARAQKYLNTKVLPLKPNLVVLQFNATDIGIDVRKYIEGKFSHKNLKSEKREPLDSRNHVKLRHRLKWLIHGILGLILRVKPSISLEDYFINLEQMVETLKHHNCHCVILTPFIFGSFYVNWHGKSVRDQILQKYSDRQGVDVVDGWKALVSKSKSQILLPDGFHLSQKGHEIIAQKLTQQVVKSIDLLRI